MCWVGCIVERHLVQQSAPAQGRGDCLNKPSGTPSLPRARACRWQNGTAMTVLSQHCPDPSHHRTTRVFSFKQFCGIRVAHNFVETVTVITSVVTVASYAYAAWNWLENIYTVW